MDVPLNCTDTPISHCVPWFCTHNMVRKLFPKVAILDVQFSFCMTSANWQSLYTQFYCVIWLCHVEELLPYSDIFLLNRTCADLTECVHRIDDELSIATQDLEAAREVNTSIIAIMRVAEVRLHLKSLDLCPFLCVWHLIIHSQWCTCTVYFMTKDHVHYALICTCTCTCTCMWHCQCVIINVIDAV